MERIWLLYWHPKHNPANIISPWLWYHKKILQLSKQPFCLHFKWLHITSWLFLTTLPALGLEGLVQSFYCHIILVAGLVNLGKQHIKLGFPLQACKVTLWWQQMAGAIFTAWILLRGTSFTFAECLQSCIDVIFSILVALHLCQELSQIISVNKLNQFQLLERNLTLYV